MVNQQSSIHPSIITLSIALHSCMYIIQALPPLPSLGAHDSDHDGDSDDDDCWDDDDDDDSGRHIKYQSHPHLASPLSCPPTSTNKRKRDKDNNKDKKRNKEKDMRLRYRRSDTEEEDDEKEQNDQCRRSCYDYGSPLPGIFEEYSHRDCHPS